MTSNDFYKALTTPPMRLGDSVVDALMILFAECQDLKLAVDALTAYVASKEAVE